MKTTLKNYFNIKLNDFCFESLGNLYYEEILHIYKNHIFEISDIEINSMIQEMKNLFKNDKKKGFINKFSKNDILNSVIAKYINAYYFDILKTNHKI